MVGFIIGAEIAFWVVLGVGLLLRYVVRAQRAGLVFLALVPVVDLVLLVVTVLDLRSGATAEWAHGLAALYLGFSVAYGPMLVRWADGWAAYFSRQGPRPTRPVGREHAIWAAKDIARALVAAAISCLLLAAAIWLVGDPSRTEALNSWFGTVAIILLITVGIDITDILWPRKR